jgi:hypothetical protein
MSYFYCPPCGADYFGVPSADDGGEEEDEDV